MSICGSKVERNLLAWIEVTVIDSDVQAAMVDFAHYRAPRSESPSRARDWS